MLIALLCRHWSGNGIANSYCLQTEWSYQTMNQNETTLSAITNVAETRHVVTKKPAPPSVYQCMVVSPSKKRGDFFQDAAVAQGWETILVADVETAAQTAVKNRIGLAVVDLEDVESSNQEPYRQLVQEIVNNADGIPLLVVCGPEEDLAGEIWSRQVGVWMYLPGVDDQSDIAMLCGEARNVVEKLKGQLVWNEQ
jgi:hypothetical protein